MRWWVLGTVFVGWVVSPAVTDWAVYWLGHEGRLVAANKQIASVEFENTRAFVSREACGNEQVPCIFFNVRIHNLSRDSTIHVKYWKLTDLRQLEGGVFTPWEDAQPVFLAWGARPEIAPGDKVLVPFARIYPPELQRKLRENQIFSGDVDTPQLRFIVDGWPRVMKSHVPPGTHRFTLTVFFEKEPPAEAEFELEWAGKRREGVEVMAQDIKIRRLE